MAAPHLFDPVLRRALGPGRAALFAANELGTDVMLGRNALARQLGIGIDGPGRDLDRECGYPSLVTIETFDELYRKEGIAARVVGVYPDECWAVEPDVYETEDPDETPFEEGWRRFVQKTHAFSWLHKADVESGIGEWAILYFGLNDMGPARGPESPVDGFDDLTGERDETAPVLKVNFMRVYPQTWVRVSKWEDRPYSSRLGQPVEYEVRLTDPRGGYQPGTSIPGDTMKVHWTRVLHVADNKTSNPAVGVPRMRPVLNRLYDLRKILGGSAEMFWKGGFPGFNFETQPGVEDDFDGDEDKINESLRKQVELYYNGLQRYIATTGMTVKPLSPQVADPKSHIEQQLQMICSTIGVPLPVFLGHLTGQLAGDQNLLQWNRRLARRDETYTDPHLNHPFIGRVIQYRAVPKPGDGGVLIDRPDRNQMTEKDKADVGLKTTQALLQYVSSGAEAVMPFYDFLTAVLRMPHRQAVAIERRANDEGRKFLTAAQIGEPVPQDNVRNPDSDGNVTPRPSRNGLGR